MLAIGTPDRVAEAMGSRVREIRLARGFSQMELAERAGLSPIVVRRFERTGRVTLGSLLRLAMALGQLDAFSSLFPAAAPRTLADFEARLDADGAKRTRGRRRDAGKPRRPKRPA